MCERPYPDLRSTIRAAIMATGLGFSILEALEKTTCRVCGECDGSAQALLTLMDYLQKITNHRARVSRSHSITSGL